MLEQRRDKGRRGEGGFTEGLLVELRGLMPMRGVARVRGKGFHIGKGGGGG